MNPKIYLFISILILFIACGENRKNSNNEENISLESNLRIVHCQEMQRKNKFFDYGSIQAPKVEPMDKNRLLIQKSDTPNQTISFDKKGLYTLFRTEYYWASFVAQDFNYNPYSTPQTLIDALKYKKDRWSFAITTKEYNDVTSQKSVGIGVVCQSFEFGCLITYVRLDSPADKIDLRRGDIISKINGINATEELFYQEAQKDKELTLEIMRNDTQQICQGSVTPQEYTYQVVDSKILEIPEAQRVAYLRIDSFLGEENIEKELERTFEIFKKEKIKNIVIDLRYNGGGSVDLASKLLNRLSTTLVGEEQFTLAWNNNYQFNNQTYQFKRVGSALNLEQIIFLTTEHTASASELIISALQPYIDANNLVVIGERTHGKPVGMGAKSDGNYYYFLINFVVKNSVGYYDYFDGLPVTKGCEVDDDPFHEMGDPNEAMLKSALNYIVNGSCQ
jgi:C-terminal processing protease CtpA/Prc